MKIKELVGIFSILGSNKDTSKNRYKGTLTLELDNNIVISAKQLMCSRYNSAFVLVNVNYLQKSHHAAT